MAAVGAVTGLSATLPSARGAGRHALKAVAFDAFTTFDTRSIDALTEQLFPGSGGELVKAWRTRQFEYTWLRTLSRSYVDFWQVTEQALVMASKLVKVTLTSEKRDRLMQAFLEIRAWPDAAEALRHMKESGFRLAFLSNATSTMLDAWVKNSGLDGIFEPHLSTDKVQAFKPAPRAYQMGLTRSPSGVTRFSSQPLAAGMPPAPRLLVIRAFGSIEPACRSRNSASTPMASDPPCETWRVSSRNMPDGRSLRRMRLNSPD